MEWLYCLHMRQAQLFPGQPLDHRQISILVGLCVAACREMLHSSGVRDRRVGVRTQEDAGTEVMRGNTRARNDPFMERDPGDQGRAPTMEPKLLLTVEEAARRLSVGRPKMWRLVMRG